MLSNALSQITTPALSPPSPPPYTFEDGDDRITDHAFSALIHSALTFEASIRAANIKRPNAKIPRPWMWLPTSLHQKYSTKEGLIPLMPAFSFSAMIFETAPRCSEKIQSYKLFLDSIPIPSASHALDVMSSIITKFSELKTYRENDLPFSKLDSMDFEYSTACAIPPNTYAGFPHKEFDFAQKSYYRLLFYCMGFLTAFGDLMPMKLRMKTKEEGEKMWRNMNMNHRTAWVEKHLDDWKTVDDAIATCKRWQSEHPALLNQALAALKKWEMAEQILSGNEGAGNISLTIIKAFGLPKSMFRIMSVHAKILIHDTAQTHFHSEDSSSKRKNLVERKTKLISEYPEPGVWNQRFDFEVPKEAKKINVEIWNGFMTGCARLVSTTKIDFSHVPDVEYLLGDNSLLDPCDGMFLPQSLNE